MSGILNFVSKFFGKISTNVSCVICSERFLNTDDVYSTKCGHVFHHACILRKRACPQCRKPCTKRNIHKIFFDIETGEKSEDSATQLKKQLQEEQEKNRSLEEKIEKLKKDTEFLKSTKRSREEDDDDDAPGPATKKVRRDAEDTESPETSGS